MVRAAEVHPQVIVYEDVHWADQATQEALLFSADSIPTSRILQILSYRTGYQHPFGERTYHTRIVLDSLSAADSDQMSKAILSTEAVPEGLNTLVARKAEGNPFFVEEVIKSLQEIHVIRKRGDRYVLAKRLDEIFVPDTIQDVIMARIDRLAEAPKKTLQLASVIGREFTRRLVDRLAEIREQTEEFLRELKAIELIYEKSLFPELAYMFKHALTHEVTYNSLLIQRRKELHLLIARAIEELYTDRLAEQYEMLAHHFSRAEEWAKALEYLLKGADKAAKAFATREAINLYDQALEAVDHLGAQVELKIIMAIHQAKANLYFILSDFARSRAESESMLLLARRAADRVGEGVALSEMGFAAHWTHDFERALAESQAAIKIAEETDAEVVMGRARLTLGMVYGVTGRLEEAAREFESVVTVSGRAGDIFRQSFALNFRGFVKNWAGDYAEALRLQKEALQIAQQHNFLFPLLQGLFFRGVTLTGIGHYDEALATMEEGLAIAAKVGDEVNRNRLFNCLGWLYMECGDLERSIELNRSGAAGARKRGDPETIANPEINLGDIYLVRGDLTLAQEFFDGVHRLVKNPATSEWMRWRYSTHLFASLGDLWLVRGDYTKAKEFCDHVFDIATRTQSKKYLVKAWRLRGEIALRHRHWDEAENAFRQALAIAQAIGNPTQLWKTHAALGGLYAETKKPELARRAFTAGRTVIEHMKASVQHSELRASLDKAPMFQRIYELSAK